jgi:hypothetical protein
MSYIVSASNQGTLGVQPATVDVPVRNAGAVDAIEIGDLVRFDMTQASSIPGQGSAANGSASNSKFANVVREAAASIATAFGIYGVALDRISVGKIGKVRVVGIATVKCAQSTYTAGETVGIPAVPIAATVANSGVQIGLGTVLTSGSNLTSVEVIFDGSFGMLTKSGVSGNGPLVYGSTKAASFLRDAQAGTDSIDVIVIGDSNSGSALLGAWGYYAGISQGLSTLGIPCYGTNLAPFVDRSRTGQARFYGTWNSTSTTIAKSSNYVSGLTASVFTPDALATPYSVWNFNTPKVSYGSSTDYQTVSGTISITGTAGEFSTTVAAQFQVGQVVTISGTLSGATITGYTNPGAGTPQFYYVIATNGTTTFQLSNTRGGVPVVTTAGTTSGLTLKTGADYDDWLFIPASATSLYQNNGISVDMNHPLAANGVEQKLRVRYGKVNAANGRFIPNVNSAGSVNSLTRLVNGGTGTTNAVSMQLGAGETAPTSFVSETTFTANGKGHSASAIGYNTNGTEFSQGPGVLLCQSLYRVQKGFAVHTHAYQSGETSTDISNVLTQAPNSSLRVWLQEIRERQIAAGGTGRVMLFMHSGINGADTTSTWTAAHTSTWSKYKAVWQELGYSLNDLAIVSMVGVQRNSADTSGNGADLVAVRAAANQMVVSNPDMCVVDIKKAIPFAAMLYGTGAASYYQNYLNNPNVASDITVHLSGGYANQPSAQVATVTSSTGITLTGTTAVTADGYWTGSRIAISTVGIAVTAIADTSGNFTCTTQAGNLVVGQAIVISGTASSGGITGYTAPGPTTYYIRATNGTTTFQLSATFNGSAITTTAGTGAGLTFAYTGPSAYQDTWITAYAGGTKIATVAQWPGNQPATGSNVTYTLTKRCPSDGYTAVSHVLLTSILSEL